MADSRTEARNVEDEHGVPDSKEGLKNTTATMGVCQGGIGTNRNSYQ
jgi:hypothetical protein